MHDPVIEAEGIVADRAGEDLAVAHVHMGAEPQALRRVERRLDVHLAPALMAGPQAHGAAVLMSAVVVGVAHREHAVVERELVTQGRHAQRDHGLGEPAGQAPAEYDCLPVARAHAGGRQAQSIITPVEL